MEQKKNITDMTGGLHTDNSPQAQPKGTYRFALNAVNETEGGDLKYRSNEQSNEPCGELPKGYIPLGQVYIGNEDTLIFSVAGDESASEIGIKNAECEYVTIVNDINSPIEDKLDFRIQHQIDSTFRLRRGCERTIYFTDNYNSPRYFNIDAPESFKFNGEWDKSKFELVRTYEGIPAIDEIEVLNAGGVLEAGSYNFAIQYLDENLNPTEWIWTSEIINVYNDDTTGDYVDIEGSINIATGQDYEDYRDFPTTDKAIRILLKDLDPTFIFYRLAFIEANVGGGEITSVKLTENIPTSKKDFIYTGKNYATIGTEDDILAFDNIISRADSIEQIENRLVLGNTEGKQINFCNLQTYASRIKADVVTKTVLTSNIEDKNNTKNPTVKFGDKSNIGDNFEGGVGYMPGEIYSFGIVYIFKDGSLSPVYHIPGKSPTVASNITFTPGDNVYPMDNNNQSLNSRYLDNATCESGNYWGYDSEGDLLFDQQVRHHRFPLRSTLGIPLVEQVGDPLSSEQPLYQLQVTGVGTIDIPCSQIQIDAGECTVLLDAPQFQLRVEYTVDDGSGPITQFMTINIDPSRESNPFEITELSDFLLSNNIVVVSIEESTGFDSTTTNPITEGVVSPKGITWEIDVVDATQTSETRLYKTDIFGIQFSGVTLPTKGDANGEEVVGYYIVRNERVEDEKTVLDSAVLTPTLTNKKYISHGLLGMELPDDSRRSKKVWGLIHPEHKFLGKKYPGFTEIIQEGKFNITQRHYSKARYRDVVDGTSFDSSIHKSGGGDDGDGWSLKCITRDNVLVYNNEVGVFDKTSDEVENLFYLDALESRDVDDGEKAIYNIAGDNKVGIVHLKNDDTNSMANKLPYVYIKRDIADSYSTFRTLPYFKSSLGVETGEIAQVFGGDTYISPMRYVNSVFWDNRIAERAGKTSVWNYIIGAILIIIAVVVIIFTWGAGTPVAALIIGAGIAVIGGAALFISAGIKRDNLVKAYYEEYKKGLRETALDNWVEHEYRGLPCYGYGRVSCDTPEDDEIEWIGDCLTDLWFESQINTSIRSGITSNQPTFLGAPGKIESGNTAVERAYEHFDVYKQVDESIYPFTKLDLHMMGKLSVFDPSRNDSRIYIGHPTGEWYQMNPDYLRINKQKVYFHLPLEYDCCSDCGEQFPHRVVYSEQSFQEELTDNYRVFLPNNYRDIEGETGQITDLFKIKNNLYIHTEEALWHLPQNIQERVTGDVVSFIGTGSFFNIPPRKIMDEHKAAGGTQHKWATLKTKYGVFFVSENEKKIYKFDGNEIKPISEIGNSKWFKKNTNINMLDTYAKANGGDYPFDNNPSNPNGVGFISTYDTEKDRVIFTKKDAIISESIENNNDFELCMQGGELIIFNNFQQTIDEQEALGWEYTGLQDCQMQFQRTVFEEVEEVRNITEEVSINENMDVHVYFDTSGSFDQPALDQLEVAVDTWENNYRAANPDWLGVVYKFNDPSERWVRYLRNTTENVYNPMGTNLSEKSVVIISFCNESNDVYHGGTVTGSIPTPTAAFLADTAEFQAYHPLYKTVVGIQYPVVFPTGGYASQTIQYLTTSLAAMKGRPWTIDELTALNNNPGLSSGSQLNMESILAGANPYPEPGFEEFGYTTIEDAYRDSLGNVITPEQFNEDLNGILANTVTTETIPINVTLNLPVTEILLIDGVPAPNLFRANNSWTMSFSLKENSWIGWHSYMPNFYYYIPEQFHSWKVGDDQFWRHNVEGKFGEFYGERFPFMLEYVSLPEAFKTKLWDDIALHTEARRYVPEMDQYVDERNITFNKAIMYNTRQCTGELDLIVKDTQPDPANYLLQQVVNVSPESIILDRNERNWSINDIRDIRVDYSQPIFNADIDVRQPNYFIDKVINTASLDPNKDWTQLESFRDKYLVVRLIFDNFEDVQLIMNYSIENSNESFR